MSPMLQQFLVGLDVPPTSREEWESFDTPALLALPAADRIIARDHLIARLGGGATDSRIVDALLALRDADVIPALPAAIRTAILPTSREQLFDVMIRACGIEDPDYRVPSRLASIYVRAGGWPPALSADVS